MVGLFLPTAVAQQLHTTVSAVGTPEPLTDIHLTLTYLGKLDDNLTQQRPAIDAALRQLTRLFAPISGTISGIGLFNTDQGDGTLPLYASYDSPDLLGFRGALITTLRAYGLTPSVLHGFTPHITLSYVPRGMSLPDIHLDPLPVLFDRLTLAWGDTRTDYPLHGSITKKGQQLAPGITRIRGDLCNVHGKYGSCATAGSGTATPRPSLRERLAATKKRPKKTPATPATAASTPTRPTVAETQRRRDAAAVQRAQERTQRAQTRRAEAERRRGAQQQAAAQRRVTQQQRASQQEAARVAQAAARETAQAERRRAREAARAARAQQAQARADAREATQQAQAARKIEALAARRQVTTPALADAARQLASGTAPSATDVQGLIRNGLAWVRNGTLTLTATGRQASRQKERQLLVVQKDARGRQRWTMISASAYRDREQEFVSAQSLGADVVRADRDSDYGPLLWWHTPVVLGDCDFNAMAGPLLIESGTFRSDQIGARIAQKQHMLGGSIAFYHPPNEPDADGVFWHIRRHERSLLPRSRASNPFTRLLSVKEQPMSAMDTVKLKELAALLGIAEEQLDGALDRLVTETKEVADAAGIAQKEATAAADDPLTPPATDAATTEKACADAQKAAPPPEAVLEDAGEIEGEAADMLFDDAELAQLAQALAPIVAQTVIDALAPALNIETKMRGYVDEMKGLMGGMQTKKDDEQALLKTQIDALKAQVDTLSGEQPRAVAHARPSERTDNIIATKETTTTDPLAGLSQLVERMLSSAAVQ